MLIRGGTEGSQLGVKPQTQKRFRLFRDIFFLRVFFVAEVWPVRCTLCRRRLATAVKRGPCRPSLAMLGQDQHASALHRWHGRVRQCPCPELLHVAIAAARKKVPSQNMIRRKLHQYEVCPPLARTCFCFVAMRLASRIRTRAPFLVRTPSPLHITPIRIYVQCRRRLRFSGQRFALRRFPACTRERRFA